MNTVTRCPDCLDGPLPGAQWDYRHTNWQWRECETCKGTGRVQSMNTRYKQGDACPLCGSALEWQESEHYNDRELRCVDCGHVPDTEERKAQDRYEQAKHDEYMDRRLEAQEDL